MGLSSLRGANILSAKQFDKTTVLELFTSAEEIRRLLETHGKLEVANGRIMATVFLEPSTRTKLSFQFAMEKLGGDVIDFDVAVSSIIKGETNIDTLRIIDGDYPNIIVLRQKKPVFLYS